MSRRKLVNMQHDVDAALEPLLNSPCLPEIAQALQTRLREESARRQEFYERISDDQKVEFIAGEVIVHSPSRDNHLIARQHLERLLGVFVSLHALGEVRGEKCLCVFPRNDYEPDIVVFGPSKASQLERGNTGSSTRRPRSWSNTSARTTGFNSS
jgi:hypothetical protein